MLIGEDFLEVNFYQHIYLKGNHFKNITLTKKTFFCLYNNFDKITSIKIINNAFEYNIIYQMYLIFGFMGEETSTFLELNSVYKNNTFG